VIIQVHNNTLECDVDATVAAFLAYTPKLPWTCDCSGCRNYRAARSLIYTDPILTFFAQFGIDTTKPAEIYEGGLVGEIFHCFCWFHFIGSIVSASHRPINISERRLTPVFSGGAVEISEMVKVDFHDNAQLVSESFRALPLVQLECEFKIPWLLPEPWGSDRCPSV
jgi:hypothetical protein